MQTTVFEATKDAVVISTRLAGKVIIRDGLTPTQAKQLAARLTYQAQDAEKYKPTRREQKFTVHFEGDFEFTSYVDADEFYTGKQLESELKDALKDLEPWAGQYEQPTKVRVNAVKVYDKQVSNE